MKKDLLSIGSLTLKEIKDILSLTSKVKKNPKRYSRALAGKTLALIFQKPSNRTYVSFAVGMTQLGGTALYLGPEQINLGVRESVHDVAKTLSRYVNGIVLRTFGHQTVVDMAEHASVPVINGLSDFSHPCQALADMFTVMEKFHSLKSVKFAYIGDGNNVCHSLMYICAKLGVEMRVATPKGYEPDAALTGLTQSLAQKNGSNVLLFRDPAQAAAGADVLYTDVWASMGQEQEAQQRKQVFKEYQINSRLLGLASKRCLVMHCLPAHRGEEITGDVLEGRQSVVFDEAENRLHVQKAVLLRLMGKG